MLKHRIFLSFCLMLALLVVQTAGLHFHVDRSAPWDASPTSMVHAEHSKTHTGSHEDATGIDLPVVGFWKSADQGSKFLALLTVAVTLLLFTVSRVVLRSPPETRPHFNRPVFLRPLLRAPPR